MLPMPQSTFTRAIQTVTIGMKSDTTLPNMRAQQLSVGQQRITLIIGLSPNTFQTTRKLTVTFDRVVHVKNCE